MSGTPELTISVPCATCGGMGNQYEEGLLHSMRIIPCPDCNGGGVTRTPVTCAGCKWYDDGTCYELCVVTDTHNWYQSVEPDFGCTRWTAKEGTDGNG